MTQSEEMQDLAAQECLDDLKYLRVGYTNRDFIPDRILSTIVSQIPGDGKLPARWGHRGVDKFLSTYGHLGAILWAAASSSHLLLVNGHHVIRVWTDSCRKCYIDINDTIASHLARTALVIESIPEGNVRKCRPFTKRIVITQQFQAQLLVDAVRNAYGLRI